MLYPIYGPIAAEPSLHLQLQHIRRSPVARLGISYQIEPRWYRCAPLAAAIDACDDFCQPLAPGEVGELLALEPFRPPFPVRLSLGEEIYLDNLLAGGINGQPLPMSISVCVSRYLPDPPLGILADCVA